MTANKKQTYFTGKPCKYGHIAERYVTNRTCVDCNNKQAVMWKNNNIEKNKELRRINYKENIEHYRAYSRVWDKNNRPKNRIQEDRRKKRTKLATPKWLTKEHWNQIESFYWLSKLQYELTDTKYHVDHIVPLKGKTVCGLHVPWNLQIMEASANIKKGNKMTHYEQSWA